MQKSNLTPLKFASASRSLRHVFVNDLIIDSHIGIYDHEKENAQKIRISVNLAVEETADPLQDNINNVLCYEAIVNKIETMVRSGHVHLVETLAENIAQMNLQDARVSTVRVRVEKLEAFANTASVGVEIERRR
ncbi:dihydroneopterin aldolase [Emcibacter sp.]|uniref:dihydroneopterin aldolase n=1 Tax=Emcibacter sp. TaxID=1979954 RepID=UPI002AA7B270|nr:dihydroneopterin aldolase [Emcibacter sp.]